LLLPILKLKLTLTGRDLKDFRVADHASVDIRLPIKILARWISASSGFLLLNDLSMT
jgi:hypothetical protein